MMRAHARPERNAIGARARLLLVAAVGSLILLGALGTTAAGAAPSAQDPQHQHPSYVVQREATVAPSSTSPARSHRLFAPGAVLSVLCLAAIAAGRIASRRRRTSRRRIEQFHVRLRGPPVVFVAP